MLSVGLLYNPHDFYLSLSNKPYTIQWAAQTHSKSKNYFKTKNDEGVLTVMDFPPQSPDLNPIEHLWGYLKNAKAGQCVTSHGRLLDTVKSCRANMSCKVLHKPVELQSMLSLRQKGNNKILWHSGVRFWTPVYLFLCHFSTPGCFQKHPFKCRFSK